MTLCDVQELAEAMERELMRVEMRQEQAEQEKLEQEEAEKKRQQRREDALRKKKGQPTLNGNLPPIQMYVYGKGRHCSGYEEL